jgi:DNA-binding transcriptional MerR regulator
VSQQLLSASDAAKLLGVTPSAVRLMMRLEQLPVATVTAGGIRLVTRDAVERLAATRAQTRASALSR